MRPSPQFLHGVIGAGVETPLSAITENTFAYTIPAAAVGYVAFKSSDYDTPGEALEAV